MPFKTKIDYSDNRQVKQREQTNTFLSGRTDFGLPISGLSSGPNLAVSATTGIYENIVTTFSGNATTTNFTFGLPIMNSAAPYLSVINNSNNNLGQLVEPYFIGVNPSVNPTFGNTVYSYYSGTSFELDITNFEEIAPNTFTGTAISELVTAYSANTLDYAGDGVWVNVNGKLKTEKLIITEGAANGKVLGCINTNGETGWIDAPSGSGSSTTTINYWTSGSSGTRALKISGSSSNATANDAMAIGFGTLASGKASLSIGAKTIASGDNSFAGGGPITSGASGNIIASGRNAFNFSISTNSDTSATGDGAVVLGGIANFATGAGALVIGGSDNKNNSGECLIAGGSGNVISGTTLRSMIIAGQNNNMADCSQSVIVGGRYNDLQKLTNVVILGGSYISAATSNTVYVPSLNIQTIGSGPSSTDIGVDAGGYVVNVSSDERLKENITTLESALGKVKSLRGVSYNWRDRVKGGNDLRVGFIAQEVKDVIPELTFTSQDGMMGVHYGNVTALLVEAIKEIVSPEYQNSIISTETIVAEDNNIELNFNGTKETATGGGITVINGVAEGENSELKIDVDGDWTFHPNIKIKNYTPLGTPDPVGNIGNVCHDDEYYYIKTSTGWKRTKLENF